jgi:large subunit ribosomal protein L13
MIMADKVQETEQKEAKAEKPAEAKPGTKKGSLIVADAENQVAGRLASRVAKELLKGSRVSIVNAERAVVSGDPKHTVKVYTERLKRGDPYHGPFYPRTPDRVLKRMIRGMMPYKKTKGSEAFKRLRVFISVPEEFKGKETKLINEQTLEDKFMSLGNLSIKLGAKKTW